jgi:hypothetical protein
MNTFFNKIYVITCRKCEYRHPTLIKHFKDCGLQFEFKYSLCSDTFTNGPISPTAKSLIYGHLKCIEDAVVNDLDRILICEDDVNFVADVSLKFYDFLKSVPSDWGYLQLGNQFWATKYLTRHQIKPNLYQFVWGTGSHCIALNKKVFNETHHELSRYDTPTDFVYYNLFKKYPTYCPENFLADALSTNDHLNHFDNKFKFPSEIQHSNE